MRDEFLYEAAPGVRQDYAQALYERLSRPGRRIGALPGWAGFNRKTVLHGLGMLLTAVIAVACAREILKQRYVQVGEIWVLEVSRSYSSEIHLPGMSELEHQNVLSRPPDPVSVGEAIDMLPYELRLPTWLPEGYTLVEDEIRPPLHPDWFVSLRWTNANGNRVAFWSMGSLFAEIHAPSGMWEEHQVQGRPAVLVRGRFPRVPSMNDLWTPLDLGLLPTPGPEPVLWKLEDRWDEEAGLGLTWQESGATLHLQTYGPYLSPEGLIRIAESMGG